MHGHIDEQDCGAEMRLRVKEHVVKKNDKHTLPKNIRQVGDVDLDKRVYIEDYAFAFIKELTVDSDEEGRVGILLGEEQKVDGENYVFVRGAMEVLNASVYDGKVSFTEETWPPVNTARNTYFPGMDIVGWYLVSSSIKPEKNASLERTHIDSIGRYKVLLYVNPAEQTEDMYSCFDGGLEALDGYIVYFDKNEEMQNYMIAARAEQRSTAADDMAVKRYRQAMRENKKEPKAKQQLSIMYALSAILVIFVLVAGVGRLQAEKNAASGTQAETENQGDYVENNTVVNATLPPVEDETLNVDYAQGNVTTTQAETENTSEDTSGSEEDTSTEEISSEEITTELETTTQEETTTEPETTTPAHSTYIVKEGDTLYGIIEKNYGSFDTARLQELLDLNGITDGGNSILPGDELLLP